MLSLEAQQISKYDIWSLILDEKGNPRLKPARNQFNDLGQRDIPVLIECFEYWKGFDEYLVIRDTKKNEYFAVKCSKRGNDVYERRLKEKLGFLKNYMGKKLFSIDDFRDKQCIKVRSPLLWITLTYDPSRYSLVDAWNNIHSEFNLWITNLRNKYGRIYYVSFIQPFPDYRGKAYGYPHFHVLAIFEDVEFNVFHNLEFNEQRELELTYRIKEKYQVEAQGNWHSWIDIKALSDGKHAYNYVLGYAKNVCYGDTDKSKINNAISWLFRKKSFNMSGDFRLKYSDLISTLRNSKLVQVDFMGNLLPERRFEFVGVYSLAELRRVLEIKDPPRWSFGLDRATFRALDRNRVSGFDV